MKKSFLLFSFLFFSITTFADSFPTNPEQAMTSSFRAPETASNTMPQNSNQLYQSQQEQPPTPIAASTAAPISPIPILMNEMQRYQKFATNAWEDIPTAKKLKYRSENSTVLLLRDRLKETGDLSPEDDTGNSRFDKHLKVAVEQFQTRHGLKADGVVGPVTFAELNIKPMDRVHQIEANITRYQQLQNTLPERYILVNVPDYRVHLIENGQEVLTMKAIVGKPDWQTPEVASRITRVIFNPFWNVPENIAINEVIPKMMEDSSYLEREHIKVYLGDSNKRVNPYGINWERIQDGNHLPYQFRQDPGDGNALGLVKFEFPNPFKVYMHDTSAKSLFDQELRALSHGCVRLENPMDLVAYLMRDNNERDSERIQAALNSGKTTPVSLHKPLPIFITYLTVFVDQNGVVNYRNDIYNKDLGSAEIPQHHDVISNDDIDEN